MVNACRQCCGNLPFSQEQCGRPASLSYERELPPHIGQSTILAKRPQLLAAFVRGGAEAKLHRCRTTGRKKLAVAYRYGATGEVSIRDNQFNKRGHFARMRGGIIDHQQTALA